jgi:DNA-binding transcriptional LysR family regulator
MLDLNQIVAFVEIVRRGNFSAAARALEIPRSTVSARVQALERALDVRLMKRTTRSNALTDDGRVFYEEVAAAVDTLRGASTGVRGANAALSGVVRLTAPPEYPLEIVSGALATFREAHPRVRLEVTLTNRTVDLVDERIDLAIRGGSVRGPGLISVRLPDVPFGLYASAGYLAQHGHPRRISELVGHELLWLKGRDQHRMLGLTRELSAAKRRAEPAIAADSMTLLKQLAVDGVGIAVLPRHLCRAERETARLTHLLPGFRGASVAAVHLVFLSRRDIPVRVRAFADVLRTVALRLTPKSK